MIRSMEIGVFQSVSVERIECGSRWDVLMARLNRFVAGEGQH